MTKNFIKEIIANFQKTGLVAAAVICVLLLAVNIPLGLIGIAICAALFLVNQRLSAIYLGEKAEVFEEALLAQDDPIGKAVTMDAPMIIFASDINGKVSWNNKLFDQTFETKEAFKKAVKSNFLAQFFDDSRIQRKLAIGDRFYMVSCADVDGDMLQRVFFLKDVTGREIIKNLYQEERNCIAMVDVDNYDELLASSPVEEQSAITAAIDKQIGIWAQQLDAAVEKTKDSRYILLFSYKHLEAQKEKNFPVLEAMHQIETKADFPTSVSIGIGSDAGTLDKLQEYANDALELALGRGGDQAAIKQGSETFFYGGALPTVEKRNKGRSRIIAHTLTQMMRSADKVLIMGHTRPDMDSLGSAIGIYALANKLDAPASIVLNEVGDAIELLYNAAVETGRFRFISSAEALDEVTEKTLLVVVDAHIPAITECPQLIDAAEKVVVIDHHRKSASAINKATLTHMEVYASSASELVTEVLQYAGEKGEYGKFEAEALLAGICVDSKNFTQNTGVRTFEAASWLRRNGADIAQVQNFFKLRLDFFKKKFNIIASAEIIGNGIAVAYTREADPSMQILVSQAADELLDMQGVDASFAAGVGRNKTMLSARSRGAVNVQVIMEALGGGGHQTVAAAQLDCTPEEAIQKTVEVLRSNGIIE